MLVDLTTNRSLVPEAIIHEVTGGCGNGSGYVHTCVQLIKLRGKRVECLF